MALTKVIGSGVQGIANASDATFLTATSAEGVTLAGTLAVTGVHTIGTNAVATSDGGAATTSIVQGLCTLNASQAIGDSLNVSGITDTSTGISTTTFTTAMANATYSSSGMCGSGQTTNPSAVNFHASGMQATGSIAVVTAEGSDSKRDYTLTTISIHGDLA
jgi:hypothetical protein